MNKRILYTAFDVVPSPKGASTHILHFIRGLVNGGYVVDLLTPGDGLLPEVDEIEGARVQRFRASGEQDFLSRAQAFGQEVLHFAEKQSHFDFVHYRSVWGGLQLAQNKNRLGYRTLFEVNGLPSIELKYHYPGLSQTSLIEKIREQELATLVLSDMLVCPSEVTKAFLISLGVPRERIHVIPNGYSPQDFTATPLPDWDHPKPTLLYTGTLADWQGLELALQALPEIITQRPVQLRIIGRGRSRQRKNISKQIRKLGLDGYVSLEAAIPHHAVAQVISAAHVCLAPLSLNDRNITQGCCPIKIIEYMASARPIVAANIPVVRELLREDLDGLFYTPGDPSDLARQVLKILDNPGLAERLSQSAAERARQKFTWHLAQKRLLKCYQKLGAGQSQS